ncbi:neuroglian-like isoform X2 [Contarinia nasturtii]|uniref:neuroglian-like isoform X2 n=1 Tax=Contarinia nasturtii TaxID=265458 RepID=UPI0012D42596|nr:neuroglian-like isoform X2 [Contarinia nasturtii]
MSFIRLQILFVFAFVFHQIIALDAPKIAEFDCRHEKREAEFSWKLIGDTSNVDSYTIEYMNAFALNEWTVATNIDRNSYKISLSPGATFSFRVIAKYKDGKSSEPSEQSELCTTKQDVPYTNPTNVEVKSESKGTLRVSWTPMPQLEHNAPDFMYRVYSREYRSDNGWNVNNVKPTENSITLKYTTFHRREFKVMAVNAMGESKATPKVFDVYVGVGRPKTAPKQFRVTVSSDVDRWVHVTFTWEKVQEENFNGYAKGYLIQYWNVNNPNEALQDFQEYGSNEIAIKLAGNCHYYATVQVVNDQYFGPISNIVEFKTPDALPDQIKEMVATPFGSTAFKLQWDSPKDPNHQIRGYNIYYRDIGGDSNDKKQKITIYNNITNYKLVELKPSTIYQLHLYAYSNAGEGEGLSTQLETKEPRKPLVPSFTWEPQNELIGYDGNVRVNWKPTTNDGLSGSQFYVKFEDKKNHDWSKTSRIISEDFTIINLKPKVTYEVIVVSVDGNYETESDVQLVSKDIFEGTDNTFKRNLIIIGIVVGAIVVLVGVCFTKSFCAKKKNTNSSE